jgi:MraZ protein
VFRGRYEHTIDGKSRTSFPSRFRELLEQRGDVRLVMTAGLDGCVVVYPLLEWTAFEQRLAQLPQFDPAVRKIKRHYVSGAVECEPDKLGRILIPATLRKHAALEREVLWAGIGQYIELWDKTRFEAVQEEELGDAASRQAIAQRLSELGL